MKVVTEIDGDSSNRIAVDPRCQMTLDKIPNGNRDRESLIVVSSAPVAGSAAHLIGSETSTGMNESSRK